MKIVLINPPALSEKEELPLSQPLGLASIAAVLREKGHPVSVIDSVALGREKARALIINDNTYYRVGLDYEEIAKLVEPDTELIGLTAPFTHHSHVVKPLIKVLRKHHKNIPIMLGGVYPSTIPWHASQTGAHYIAIGEGEPIITAFANGVDIGKIDGLYRSEYFYGADSESIPDYTIGVVDDLNSLPFPARDLLPFDLYLKSKGSGRGKGKFGISIHTSRGCPFACAFCSVHSVFKRGYRARSVEKIWEEMQEIINRYNIFHFEFEDDNLTLIRERAVGLFSKIADWNNTHDKKITFATPNGVRIDTLDKDLIFLMREAGCERLSLALEHGDQEMLDLMNKKLNLEKVREVVANCQKAGIKLVIYLIVGFPGETLARWKKGIKFAKKLKRINGNLSFSLHAAKALPGTQLYNFCKNHNYLAGPNPNEMVLIGNIPNISTPDFSVEDIIKRVKKTEKILNPTGIFRKSFSKLQKLRLKISR
ncbi:MAG: radical SAM protein [Patescibacteria group bacterium]